MTIEQIAKTLNDCANEECSECDYLYFGDNTEDCRPLLVKDMANECRTIAETLGDDCK